MSDKILIEGLECLARVGVPEEERQRPQKVSVDLELQIGLSEAGASDEVDKTIDYAVAAALAKQVAESGPYKLVEAIAERVAAALLKAFPTLDAVDVRIRKFSVPQAESAGVEITRSRS